MINKDIEGISIEMQKINSKMMQALKLHNDIAIRRGKAIAQIRALIVPATYKTRGIEDLKRCHEDEKMLLRITAPAILRTKDILETMTAGSVDKLKKEDREILNTLFTALKIIENKIPFTKVRIAKEEEYIKSPNNNTQKEYCDAWLAELKLDKQLIKSVIPKHLQLLAQLETVKAIPTGKITKVGGALGIVAGILGMLSGETTPKEAAIFVLYASALSAASGIAVGILKATTDVLETQQNALIQLQQR